MHSFNIISGNIDQNDRQFNAFVLLIHIKPLFDKRKELSVKL